MLRSSNDETSAQNFTIRVTKTEEGKFKATTPNVKGLEVTASTQQTAAQLLGDQLQQRHAKGEL